MKQGLPLEQLYDTHTFGEVDPHAGVGIEINGRSIIQCENALLANTRRVGLARVRVPRT